MGVLAKAEILARKKIEELKLKIKRDREAQAKARAEQAAFTNIVKKRAQAEARQAYAEETIKQQRLIAKLQAQKKYAPTVNALTPKKMTKANKPQKKAPLGDMSDIYGDIMNL